MAADEKPDWYARDWLRHKKRKQADLADALGWDKGRTSKIINSRQPYTRENINEVSEWLGIEPFELLMKPDEANALRRLRETAQQIIKGF